MYIPWQIRNQAARLLDIGDTGIRSLGIVFCLQVVEDSPVVFLPSLVSCDSPSVEETLNRLGERSIFWVGEVVPELFGLGAVGGVIVLCFIVRQVGGVVPTPGYQYGRASQCWALFLRSRKQEGERQL